MRPSPSPTPVVTPTPVPTVTPAPVGTPSPTPTDQPTATPIATPQPPANMTIGEIEAEILRLTNAHRQANGRIPLAGDARLAAFARSRSLDMATRNYFSHTTPDGQSVFDLLKAAAIPFRAARENIAWNSGYAADKVAGVAVMGWIASAGHNANLLATDVTTLGVGVAQKSTGAYYLTQVFTD
ncbi:MAG: CAP domain-containing protein [Candidatus Sericytochromatia bacterium]|nr:CAP domain-containing protein [Candidatus Sericytochromatia bacterium]